MTFIDAVSVGELFGAHLAVVKPFVIRRATDFRTAGPPALGSAAYARDLNEVEALGSTAGTVRTRDQTESAIWWHDLDASAGGLPRRRGRVRGRSA
ncbi:hypothetical protein AB0J83_49920 [Actinoplanes sp. NPDC049596]|uniref:hypothetical protein n=1 Tax=unclassified Actinoplanes TaxID=2626549 RepID=UPI0034256ECA